MFSSPVASDRLSIPDLPIINFGMKVTTLAQSGRQMKCQRKAPQSNLFLALSVRNRCNFLTGVIGQRQTVTHHCPVNGNIREIL